MKTLNEKQKKVQQEMRIDCKKVTDGIIAFLKDYFEKSKRKKAVLGLSGGIDSAVVASLCCRTLGTQNVILAMLPYRSSWSSSSVTDADLVIGSLDIPSENVYSIDINDAVDVFARQKPDEIGLGNMMAQTRMIYLYHLARKYQGLVIGTSNRSEILLGYFTRWGDGACDLEPIGNLYKTQIFKLAEYLNIPERIIKKVPTAGLWTGQTDEGEIGYSYNFLDVLLYLMFDKKISIVTLVRDFDFEKKDITQIRNRVLRNKFKQSLAPVCRIDFKRCM